MTYAELVTLNGNPPDFRSKRYAGASSIICVAQVGEEALGKSIEQGINASTLPGLVGAVMG